MNHAQKVGLDAVLYAVATAVAFVALYNTIPVQAEWARFAVGPYALATIIAAALALWWWRRPAHGRTWVRVALMLAVLVACALVPVAREITWRIAGPENIHAQSEVLITEQAAIALVQGHDPYAVSYAHTPLGHWPPGVWLHLPYMPAIVLFGLPRALFTRHLFTDARIYFVLTTLVATAMALRLSRASVGRKVWVVLALIALPTGARFMAGGGDDITVLALMLLAVMLHKRGRPLLAGVVAGLAASIKQTAWPLLPYLLVTARDRDGRPAWKRFTVGCLAVIIPAVTPFLLWNPVRFFQDVVLYPYGLAKQPTIAESPMIGRLLALAIPEAKAQIAVGLGAVAIVVALWLLLVRRPTDTGGAALRAAIVLTLLIVLATAGRWGYLIYPLNLVVWSRLLLAPDAERPAVDEAPAGPSQLAHAGGFGST